MNGPIQPFDSCDLPQGPAVSARPNTSILDPSAVVRAGEAYFDVTPRSPLNPLAPYLSFDSVGLGSASENTFGKPIVEPGKPVVYTLHGPGGDLTFATDFLALRADGYARYVSTFDSNLHCDSVEEAARRVQEDTITWGLRPASVQKWEQRIREDQRGRYDQYLVSYGYAEQAGLFTYVYSKYAGPGKVTLAYSVDLTPQWYSVQSIQSIRDGGQPIYDNSIKFRP